MREIKFRAWEIRDKKMISWDELADNYEVAWGLFNNKNQKIPLQFTGLKDKNGKEIYEGDIVKETNLNYLNSDGTLDRKSCEEHSIDAWGVVEYVTYNCSFMVMRRQFDRLTDQWNNSFELHPNKETKSEIEVIGNIYQNPELLKKD